MPPRKKVELDSKSNDATVPPKVAPQKEGGRRNLRGKRGGLKDMPSMPLDILMEILCLLEPRDLLNLARTTKPFRKLLMNRSSASMWKAARSNVEDLPDCPAHLSEPAYANLAFFPYCHNCLKPNVQTVLWEFGKRYCPSCLKANTESSKDWRYSGAYSWASCLSYLAIFSKVRVNGRNELYHRPELDRIRPFRERLRNDSAGWQKFTQEQRQRVGAVSDHAALCHAWSKKRAANRSAELQDVREQRLATIVSKLRELGWGDELDRIAPRGYEPLCDHPHVKLSKPLATRGWLNIKDDVVAQMKEIKQKRLREERSKIIYQRLTLFRTAVTAARSAPPKRTAADEYKPKCRDLAMMPEVRRLIEVPNDAVVSEESLYEAIVPMLPALEARWERECKADLLRALRDDHVEAQDGVDILDLAVAVFQCRDCRQYLHHPSVIIHECETLPLLCSSTEFQYADYFKCVFEACGYIMPWSVSRYRVACKLDRVRALVEMCGKDPKAATQKNMDDLGGKLVYDEPEFGATLMSWRRAIKYVHASLRQDLDATRWRVATEEDKAAVKAREDEQMDKDRKRRLQYGNMRCGWCDAPRQHSWHSICDLGQLKPHLSAKHGVESPTLEDGDYYLHPDDECELEPIRIKPTPYDALMHHIPWMDFDLDDFDL